MRVLAAGFLMVTVAACASPAVPDGGVASYDALSIARQACLAKGKDLVLTPQGDGQSITAYTCKRK